jgi:hypothetical protein
MLYTQERMIITLPGVGTVEKKIIKFYVEKYLNKKISEKEIHEEMAKLLLLQLQILLFFLYKMLLA